MSVKKAMSRGHGGVTIAEVPSGTRRSQPGRFFIDSFSGRQFMIMNGSVYTCRGNIIRYNNRQPSCNGQLEMVEKDICLPGSNMIILNNIVYVNDPWKVPTQRRAWPSLSFSRCIGDNIGIVNNKCYGGWEGDINLVRQSCGYTFATSNYATYDYYPTDGLPPSVQFYNNADAKCQNSEANHCVFTYF